MPSSEHSVRLDGEQWWVVPWAAEMLMVTSGQVRRLVRRAKLRSRRIGGVLWVAKADVERYGRERGYWRPGGVVGGKLALERQQAQVAGSPTRFWGGRDAA